MTMTVTNTGTAFSTVTTAHVCDIEATVNADDILIVIFCHRNEGADHTLDSIVDSTSDAWTELFAWTHDGADGWGTAYWKRADGDEGGGTVTLTTDLGSNTGAAGVVVRIQGAHTTTAPESSGSATASTNSPDCPSITAGWGAEAGNVFLACVSAGDDNATIDTAPTSFSIGGQQAAGAAGNASRECGYCEWIDSNNATVNPSTMGLSESEAWVAWTLVVREESAGGGVRRRQLSLLGAGL